MKRKSFIVEVPCTVMDRYVIFADSEQDVQRKISSGEMTEQTREKFGDYLYEGPTDAEPETHWNKAVIVGESGI
jgi:hypothetical protein